MTNLLDEMMSASSPLLIPSYFAELRISYDIAHFPFPDRVVLFSRKDGQSLIVGSSVMFNLIYDADRRRFQATSCFGATLPPEKEPGSAKEATARWPFCPLDDARSYASKFGVVSFYYAK